jgi:hypothetical protein
MTIHIAGREIGVAAAPHDADSSGAPSMLKLWITGGGGAGTEARHRLWREKYALHCAGADEAAISPSCRRPSVIAFRWAGRCGRKPLRRSAKNSPLTCSFRPSKLIETCVARFQPAIVFTHHTGDVNVDHRLAHDAVLAACRPQPGHPVKELYFFEIPSSTELRTFPHPRSLKAVEALACWRGATVGVAATEAFMVGRQII